MTKRPRKGRDLAEAEKQKVKLLQRIVELFKDDEEFAEEITLGVRRYYFGNGDQPLGEKEEIVLGEKIAQFFGAFVEPEGYQELLNLSDEALKAEVLKNLSNVELLLKGRPLGRMS